jgi:4'-phosphopantetheinyl transferase
MSTTSLSHPALPTSEASGWAPGPTHPRLANGAVHVWRADLSKLVGEPGELLCARERARAERLPGERGELWARSRGTLRALLGRYLGADPGSLRFATGIHGKPRLIGDRGWLRFNLSHSQQLALYAIAEEVEIGVDVQVARPGDARGALDEVAVARRAFGDSEARRLDGLEQTARERELLRLWTRHEAELKCAGTGIGGGMRASAAGASSWIAELDVGARAAGAVAIANPPSELRRWEWQP